MPPSVAKPARADLRLAEALAVGVARLGRRLRQERRSDLTPNQLAVLGALRRSGPMTVGSLAELERVRPPSMTRTINCLAEAGQVVRVPDPSDGRQVLVTLAEEGAVKLAAERQRRDLWLAEQLSALTPAERELLREAAAILERMSSA